MNLNSAQSLLGLQNPYTLAEAAKAWKSLSRKHHPDVGGDSQLMAQINAAWDIVQKHLDPKVRERNTQTRHSSEQQSKGIKIDVSTLFDKQTRKSAYRLCEAHVDSWLTAVKKANPYFKRLIAKPTQVSLQPLHFHVLDHFLLDRGRLTMMFTTRPLVGKNVFIFPRVTRIGTESIRLEQGPLDFFYVTQQDEIPLNGTVTTTHHFKMRFEHGTKTPVSFTHLTANLLLNGTPALDTYNEAIKILKKR